MPALTQKQAIKEYKALEQWVLDNSGVEATDLYYTKRDVFVAQLSAFIRQRGNMAALSGAQMLGLCSMVSIYRPMEPFAFLIQCAKEVE